MGSGSYFGRGDECMNHDLFAPDTIHYFPQHISAIEEFKRISKVYDKMLNLVWDELDKYLDNRHFDTMDQAECAYWERILKIHLTGYETLDDRRKNIKGYWASGLPYTKNKVWEFLDATTGMGNYEFQADTKKKNIQVIFKTDRALKDNYIYDKLRQMIPADMEIIMNRVVRNSAVGNEYTIGIIGTAVIQNI
jgi:hypothetical protein